MAITIHELTKTYRARKSPDVNALKGVSFDLPETGMVFVLGKSGCGKSTLLNLLGGLDGFDGGDILVDGKSMKEFSARDMDDYRNNYTGFVFQENNLLNEYTVKRNVSLALDLQSEKNYDGRVEEALEAVELKDFGGRKCNRLSGGQKQRVAIARAIVKRPKLLLCDEPTGALDSDTGDEIFSLLKKLSADRLVVVVSHDRDSAEQFGDRIIEMKDGAVISDSAPIEKNDTPNAQEAESKKHRAMPVKRVFEIGAGFLIARPVRLVLCVIICLISFTCIGVADTLASYKRATAIEKTMELYDCSHLSFSKIRGYDDDKFSDIPYAMNAGDSAKLNELIKGKRKDNLYRLHYSVYGSINNEYDEILEMKKSELWYWFGGYIEIDGTLPEDYGFELYGRLPQNLNEVVIPRHIYDGFVKCGYSGAKVSSYDDVIGKDISLRRASFPQSASTVYKVVGILDTGFKDAPFTDVFNGKENTMQNIQLQALASSSMHNALFTVKGFRAASLDKILENNRNQTEETLEDIKAVVSTYPENIKDLRANIRICENYQEVISLPEDEQRTFMTYNIYNDVSEALDGIDENMKMVSKILYFVSLGLAVVSALFVLYFTSGIVAEKKREIGILRALGASRGDVVGIFAAENGIFAAGIILLSTILSIIGVTIANGILTAEFGVKATLISFAFRQFAVLAAVAVAAVIVGIAIPVIKLLCKKPVDVIAGR